MPETKFEIPAGTPASVCRGCGAAIFWINTGKGRAMPADADGTSHFATCPQANKFGRERPAKRRDHTVGNQSSLWA